MSDLYTALRGHQITTYKPTPGKKEGIDGAKYKAWEIHCSCGWHIVRPKVLASFNEKTGKAKHKDEDLTIFRARGAQHLYEVWLNSRQGVLDV